MADRLNESLKAAMLDALNDIAASAGSKSLTRARADQIKNRALKEIERLSAAEALPEVEPTV